ncbi:hypothetical protein [Novosphingobium sp. TH158]|uniref:hypothetical protein n=1 Tax=Novosphingobium sp. TH158 TaxID=2067455 RepID=UPI001304071B|nr:hypothetical protein [Novosphingobium sp. TH158]
MPKKNKARTEGKAAVVEGYTGESEAETMARVFTGPTIRHGSVASSFIGKMFGQLPGQPQFDDYGRAIATRTDKAKSGDLAAASEMLMAQAISLDAMFTELARRCAMNMGDYIHASERYGRLALKAQSNCRATLEALAKLHQPRIQTVRHVHVNEGGQAVIADQFHHHGGCEKNARSKNQSHATGAAGESAALPSPDPLRNGVPISGGEGEAALQDARRDQSGGT